MPQELCHQLPKKSNNNRRRINEDGSIPTCLMCGEEARKHPNRKRWLLTCGDEACILKLRIDRMKITKTSEAFKEVGIAAAKKAIATQRSIVIDGKTKAELTAEKIKQSNLKVGDDGLTSYQRGAIKSAPNVRMSNEVNGHWKKLSVKSNFEQYRVFVSRCQRKFTNEISQLKNFDKRAPSPTHDGYHIDHRISIWFGFMNNIPPEKIGHICNLEMKSWLDNNKKWNRCDITLQELDEAIIAYEIKKITLLGISS